MKKTAVVFALIVLSLAVFLPFSLNNLEANAQGSSYSIQHVDHNIQVLYSGHVVVTEKILLSGSLPSTFQIGLPYKYGSYILKGIAYDSDYTLLPIALGVQLQDQSGFYGASVSLPSGSSNNFTVVFVLSNGVLTPTTSGYTLDFPGYPSFTQVASDCSVSIVLPSGATISEVDKSDGVVTSNSYNKANLAAFSYSTALATFSAGSGVIQEVNIPSLNRQIIISPSGALSCTDTYKIINNSTSGIASFLINLPVNASNVVARDQFGKILSIAVQQTNSQVFVENVTLAVTLNSGESSLLTLDYSLPSISSSDFARYVLTLDLFPYFNYYIDSGSLTITPPEGAIIVTPKLSEIGPSDSLTRNVFQESLSINKDGVSYIDSTIPSQELCQLLLIITLYG